MSQAVPTQEQELHHLRQQIDAIDRQIQTLINERAACAKRVAQVKQQYQGVDAAVYYRPEREAQILRQVMERNQGPLENKAMARVFRELMSACLAHEQIMRIAFLGHAGSFTQTAIFKHFGHAVQSMPLNSINEVFREIEVGSAHYGVVPIENLSENMISHTLDSLRNSALMICGEVEIHIHHNLLLKAGTGGEVTQIYAHPQSLVECQTWLDNRFPEAERITVCSDTEAARQVSQATSPTTAAISSEMAATSHNLHLAYKNIEDQPNHTTRFLIIGHNSVPMSDKDKTSLLIWSCNKPGVLYNILAPFHRHQINLTSITSRPSNTDMQGHIFYIDFEGHYVQTKVKQLLQDLQQEAIELKVLGSYPQAVL